MDVGKLIVWLIVGALAGNVAGRLVTFKREGLGRWTNLAVGIFGALIGGYLFSLFDIDFGMGEIKITVEDLIAAFVGSLLLIFVVWIVRRIRSK